MPLKKPNQIDENMNLIIAVIEKQKVDTVSIFLALPAGLLTHVWIYLRACMHKGKYV